MEKLSKVVGRVAAERINKEHGNDLVEGFSEAVESMDPASRRLLTLAAIAAVLAALAFLIRSEKTPREILYDLGIMGSK